ncbi:hypothetical protein RRG08_008595 [Elysia crispata]|uniref:Uncharacterized protein n=1 Tax=Elysia crispata TaxID=231223 RepID=A0AAE1B768_9GAST|nr:hypothetical protein RRG08_008595 [Elysia crispata]
MLRNSFEYSPIQTMTAPPAARSFPFFFRRRGRIKLSRLRISETEKVGLWEQHVQSPWGPTGPHPICSEADPLLLPLFEFYVQATICRVVNIVLSPWSLWPSQTATHTMHCCPLPNTVSNHVLVNEQVKDLTNA